MFAAYSGCKISNFFVINQKFTLIFPLTHTFFHIYFVPLQRENNNTLNTNIYFMINSQDIKKGTCIRMDGKLYFCIDFLHRKPGKGNTIMNVTLKDVVNGGVIEKRFNIGEKLEDVRVERRPYQYLYKDGDDLVFMNNETFEKINIATEQGSDPIYPDRGTNLLASSINGLLIDKVEAQHAGNFAALDTLTFCNFNDYAAATKGSGDIITAMTIVPTSYDMDKRVLRFDVTMTFADGTSNPIRATVNG